MTQKRYDVFLSHNSADKRAVEAIARRLRAESKLNPFLDTWHLVPGVVWQEALEEALAASETVAVFIGPSGISPWHNEEMRTALDRAVRNSGDFRVVPVLLPDADESAVATFLDRHERVDFRSGLDDSDAFGRLVAGIRGEPPENAGAFTLPDEPAPYVGLRAFTTDQKRFFFGRSAERDALLKRIRKTPFVIVVGASGSGKSSLVCAGLAQVLPEGWSVMRLVPGARPLRALADLVATLGSVSSAADRVGLADSFETRMGEREDGLATAISTVRADAKDAGTLLIIVDQFEEIFTQATGAPDAIRRQQAQFIANLVGATELSAGKVRVIATLRDDFVTECRHWAQLGALIDAEPFKLGPITEAAALREAIVRPAYAVGALFQQGLASRLIEESTDNALPLLQFALAQLWEKRRGVWLTHEAHDAIGGVGGALEQRANEVYGELSPRQQLLARAVFKRLVALGEGADAADTRRRVRSAELRLVGADPAEVDQLVQTLSGDEVRLVSADAEKIEVAHEALIDRWGLLKKWVADDRPGMLIHRKITNAAEEWSSNGRDASFLFRGSRLARAEEWAQKNWRELSEEEKAFVDAGVAERRVEEARWRRRAVVATVAAVAATGIALVAFLQYRVANALSLAGESYRALDGRLEEAARLALRALATNDGTESKSAVLYALIESAPLTTMFNVCPETKNHPSVSSLAFRPDRQILAVGCADGAVELWDAGERDSYGKHDNLPVDGREVEVNSIAFSPNGRLLAVSTKRSVSLYDSDGVMLPSKYTPLQAVEPNSLSFSPDGSSLASGNGDGTIVILRVPDLKIEGRSSCGADRASVTGISFSFDGRYLVSATESGRVCLSDRSRGAWDSWTSLRVPSSEYHGEANAVAIDPAGHTIAAGWDDGAIQLWDACTLRPIGDPLRRQQGSITSLAFGHNGTTLASSSADGTVLLWDVGRRRTIGGPLAGHRRPATSVVFDATGVTMASGGEDGIVALWNLDLASEGIAAGATAHWDYDLADLIGNLLSGHLRTVLAGHNQTVTSLAFRPTYLGDSDPPDLASGDNEGTVVFWDPIREEPRVGQQHLPRDKAGDKVDSIAYSPDGTRLAVGTHHGSTWVWRMNGSARAASDVTELTKLAGPVRGIAFSPSGRLLAFGNDVDTGAGMARQSGVILWDIVRGRQLGSILPMHTTSVAFSPGGSLLATASGSDITTPTIALWNVTTRDNVGQLVGHDKKINSVAFSHDGRQIVSSSDDGSVRLWDVSTQSISGSPLMGHLDDVASAVFSPDDRLIASGSGDGGDGGMVILWDAASRKPIGPPLHTPGPVTTVAFSPDGRWLASAGKDRQVRLWPVTLDDWTDILKAKFAYDLSTGITDRKVP